jgi:hypothetical protein
MISRHNKEIFDEMERLLTWPACRIDEAVTGKKFGMFLG